MASYLSHLSSPGNDAAAAVDAIIAEALDHCALEQVARLNTAHLSDSSLLPTELEDRFRKLKSFPGANNSQKPRTPTRRPDQGKENVPRSLSEANSPIDAKKPEKPTKKPEVPVSEPHGYGAETSSPSKPVTEKDLQPQLRSGSASSPSISPNSSRESPSPPRQRCCFGCSPRKVQRKKGKEDDWWTNEEVLSSLKEQQRKLKKALKEQEKVSREAAKMVKWVKQASARMNEAAMDDLMSDDEELK